MEVGVLVRDVERTQRHVGKRHLIASPAHPGEDYKPNTLPTVAAKEEKETFPDHNRVSRIIMNPRNSSTSGPSVSHIVVTVFLRAFRSSRVGAVARGARATNPRS